MIIGAGSALLSGRELRIVLPQVQAGTASLRMRSMMAFGASYAIAPLSCTLPVFLGVVASTFTAPTPSPASPRSSPMPLE